jgi:hypothetical protein
MEKPYPKATQPPAMIEDISHNNVMLALVIRHTYRADGIQFFTPGTFSQQLGYMNRPAGYIIPPHTHNPVPRTVEWTQEVLYIKSGKVRLDIYTTQREYLRSLILEAGDVVLLAHGGHGFSILEDAEIIEVKQGPYAGEADKVRFPPIDGAQARFE